MAAVAVLFSLASGAEAATVTATLVARDAAAWEAVDAKQSTDLPQGAAWAQGPLNNSVWELPSDVFPIAPTPIGSGLVADPCRNACSPFYGGVYQNKGTAIPSALGWETTEFWVVFAPRAVGTTNTAELRFSGRQSALSLLWGSPDNENMVEFFLGGEWIGSFTGTALNGLGTGIIPADSPGRGAALVTLSGITFDTVRFSAKAATGSFEFSNLRAVSAVPVPASLLLLLTGLGAVAAVGRRRRA